MAAAGEKTLAHSELKRSLIGAFPSAYHPPYCYYYYYFFFSFFIFIVSSHFVIFASLACDCSMITT